MIQTENPGSLDVVLIGAGIMSATIGTMLKELEPSLKITVFETLENSGQESSQAWNNAGTGHAANCRLSTPHICRTTSRPASRSGPRIHIRSLENEYVATLPPLLPPKDAYVGVRRADVGRA
jgi:glycine/D-amino acid oxidase-like deaminating enzyme